MIFRKLEQDKDLGKGAISTRKGMEAGINMKKFLKTVKEEW